RELGLEHTSVRPGPHLHLYSRLIMAEHESRRALGRLPLALLVAAVLLSLALSSPTWLPAWLGGKPGNQQRYRAYLAEFEALQVRYFEIQTSLIPRGDDPAQFTPAATAERLRLFQATRAEYHDRLRALRARHGLPPVEAADEYTQWTQGLTPWDE